MFNPSLAPNHPTSCPSPHVDNVPKTNNYIIYIIITCLLLLSLSLSRSTQSSRAPTFQQSFSLSWPLHPRAEQKVQSLTNGPTWRGRRRRHPSRRAVPAEAPPPRRRARGDADRRGRRHLNNNRGEPRRGRPRDAGLRRALPLAARRVLAVSRASGRPPVPTAAVVGATTMANAVLKHCFAL